MTIFETTIPLSIGYDLIDNDHGIFIDLVNQLDKANNTDFPELFQRLYEHTEAHFESENRLMAQCGFPAETEHRGQHQLVLSEFKQFKTRIDKGLITFGRSFVRERLPQWFLLHVTTMDSALSAHIKMQQELPGE